MSTLERVLANYEKMTAWAERLIDVPADRWLEPMRSDKWSIAETVAHLAAWNRFVGEERLPRMRDGVAFSAPPDVARFNECAAEYARSGVTQARLVDELVDSRTVIAALMREISVGEEERSFTIGGRPVTLSAYLAELTGHDEHHRRQIEEFLGGANAEERREIGERHEHE